MLGHTDQGPGIADIVPEPNNIRYLANYRIYCDNDRRDPNPGPRLGNPRWQLKDDPHYPPLNYKPQRERPLWRDARPGEEWQEYVDHINGMEMMGTDGCNDPNIAGVSYVVARHGSWTQQERATITVCQLCFSRLLLIDVY